MQANIVCPLTDDHKSKVRMLQTTSTIERYELCQAVLTKLQDANITGCSIM